MKKRPSHNFQHRSHTHNHGSKLCLWSFLFLVLAILAGCAGKPSKAKQHFNFKNLDGWNEEQVKGVKPALLNSCEKLNPAILTHNSPWGEYSQWQSLCKELAQTPNRQLKAFFEQNFAYMLIESEKNSLYTGYYSPVFQGVRTKKKGYQVPLLKLPNDLVRVSLTDFDLSGKDLVGRVENGLLKPYNSRAKINQQNPDPDDVLLWLKSPVDKFFLQIQGSGNVQLDGEIFHVGYAGNNGHDYVSIGKLLKQKGELSEISMKTIKQWLNDNPDKLEWLLEQNPRYIFFTFSDEGAITSQGVPATAWRTLAVDPEVIALGMPVWLKTKLTATNKPFHQLMVTQDTGNSIKGSGRGDIYMGVGDIAAGFAGEQKSLGRLYVLVPK